MLKKHIKKHYDSTALTWRKKIWVHDPNFKSKIKAFAGLHDGDKHLLDVGIGAGDFSSLFDVSCVTGIDFSENHIKECHKLHPNFQLVLGDAEYLPFEDCQFDLVCARNLLQNFVNPVQPIKEIFRVLKPSKMLLSVESAVLENERIFPTAICRVVEPLHPLFPSHESLRNSFSDLNSHGFIQRIEKVHGKWLSSWQESKGATMKQREKIFQICEQYPMWYKKKYNFKFYPDELEVESSITFSLIKMFKAAS